MGNCVKAILQKLAVSNTRSLVVLPNSYVENADGGVDVGSVDGSPTVEEKVDGLSASPILTSLQQYKESIRNNDDSIIAEIETFFLSIESEKYTLEKKVVSLSEELLVAKDRILRISADFDNFRKRTDKERLSLVSNAQGEVIENLLPVLDNFERAKAQIKLETEGEEKINNSYQSIYKQFTEILTAIGVIPVETIGKPFDPLVAGQVGSTLTGVIDKLSQLLSQAFSGFRSTWKRF
ncbi:GrpE-like protein [Drosera capensis]